MTLSQRQITVIRQNILRGKRIQESFPEIADAYRQGSTHPEILHRYSLDRILGVAERDALASIHHALCGHDQGLNIHPYEGLLSTEEALELRTQHRREGGLKTYEEGSGCHGLDSKTKIDIGRRSGLKTQELGIGIFAATEEERKKWATNAGTASYEQGKGIHNQTTEGKKEAARLSVQARGRIPFITDEQSQTGVGELEFAIQSYISEKFVHKSGRSKGQFDWQALVDTINDEHYHGEPVRKVSSFRATVYKTLRKQQE